MIHFRDQSTADFETAFVSAVHFECQASTENFNIIVEKLFLFGRKSF